MNFHFRDKDLLRLFVEDAGAAKAKLPPPVINKFFAVMSYVADAIDERDLRSVPGFHFEKLQGDRAGLYSLRINQQFRLVFAFKDEDGEQIMEVIELTDYH
jgi:proteic killer suppression protein